MSNATIDTRQLSEHMLRCMADELGDHRIVKDEKDKRRKYANAIELWHVLANGIGNREAADTCQAYANKLADHYAAKGKYTRRGNYTIPYKRIMDEGIKAMIATFEEG